MTINEKKQIVYDLLLTPIICETCKDKQINIKKENGVITSSQKYNSSTPDADMSDFAIKFYKVLYGDNLLNKKNILNDDGSIVNKELAGDTMNSFNKIANMFNNSFIWKAGKIMITLNPYLMNYKLRYHCLANFWVIPMRHGRTDTKLNKYDSPILYVDNIKNNWELFSKEQSISYRGDKTEYSNYFTMFKDKDYYKDVHFLPTYDDKIYKETLSKEKNEEKGLQLVQSSLNYIYARANKICEDETMVENLYDCFRELRLVDL